jgi:Domain of unknown function (DUF4844)
LRHQANIFLGLTFLLLISCERGQIKTPTNAMDKFDEFKKKEKFVAEQFYPGIADPKMRPLLTDKINQAADDFSALAKKGKATDKDYQNKIKIGLQRFDDIYLNIDTEDRERICAYFEELMDIVGLESSGGYLNNFTYGFDPTAK